MCPSNSNGGISTVDNATRCCIGGDACKDDSFVEPAGIGGKVCCRGKLACGTADIKIGKGGLCCDSTNNGGVLQSVCQDAEFYQYSDVGAQDRLPIACIGLQSCYTTTFPSVTAPVDMCCNGIQACYQVGTGGSNLGPPSGSTVECRDNVPDAGNSNNGQTCQEAELTDRTGGTNSVCCVDDGAGTNSCEDLCNAGCNCQNNTAGISWCPDLTQGDFDDTTANYGQWTCGPGI